MKPNKPDSRRVPPEKAASLEEIEVAVESLSGEDLWRLKEFARYRLIGLGRAARGRTPEDLLHDAIAATCDPARRSWRKDDVSFIQHLKGVIRSISSHLRDQFDEDEALLEAEVARTYSDADEFNPLLEAVSPLPNAERSLAAKEELALIERLVESRPLASLIVWGMRDEMSGPEIKKLLDISQKEYETEMRWLRRSVRGSARKAGSHV